ncbi:MAG: UDP-N-acetylmuramoyl-L-alanyl-D-glutamate--2,6-diaminopimelate ligase [Bacteroidales bacterium]|nr:UDP-N-acetylmuramoyl-L-alanyl-D-glutamate--2,6-diaminopimelate ligase [Bacteroidales bacterium]
MKRLNDIIKDTEILDIINQNNILIDNICFDSRLVKQNSLFVAIRGVITDGHKYIDIAIEKGATAVLCEELPLSLNNNIIYIKVKNSNYSLSVLAANYYGHPSKKLKLTGITGTNGKTTTATLLYKLFNEYGKKAGLISTINYQWADKIINATYTTPDVLTLNYILSEMVKCGCEYCFMEVSSHSVVQKRIAGLKFTGAVFTNITLDHLDYHKTFDEYIKAKKSFFDNLDSNAFALSNIDDKNGNIMTQNTKAGKYSYSLKQIADYKAKLIEKDFAGNNLEINGSRIWTKLTGVFNAYNALCIYAVADLLGLDKELILSILSNLNPVKGRFDYIISKENIVGIIDYAHTPDALSNVLNTIREIKKPDSRVITVVGCGGDRDKSKRPIMAKIAIELSNKLILTSDNPRSEDPLTILEQMEAGIDKDKKNQYLTISDRREAIKTACMLAQPGDIILIAGKGHEIYQEIKGIKYDFDDKKTLIDFLIKN